MTKKAKVVPTNGDTPATQHDLSLLAGEMTRRFEQVDKRFEQVDERFDGIDERLDGIDQRLDTMDERLVNVERQVGIVLKLVQSIDDQLKEWRDIPAKVERLHHAVFPRQ